MPSTAEVMIETVKAAGVKRVYGLPGDSLNAFTDALRKDGTLEWVHVRHEEVAALAAAAEAHLTDEVAVVAASCGPGNLHLINGLYDAQRSRVPVVAIASHIPSSEIGSGYFQETHPQQLFQECSVYCEMAGTPEQLPRILEIAFRTAVAERGVAVVVVPSDVMLAEASGRRPPSTIQASRAVVVPAHTDLLRAVALLDAAERVTILAGAGCAGAHGELVGVAEVLKAPIVHTMRGKEYVEHDNPYDVGMTGLLGFSSGYRAMEACDVLLMLGTDFPYPQFFPEHAAVIQVDVRGAQLGKRTPIDLGLVGDVGETLRVLTPLLDPRSDDGHLMKMLAHYARSRKELDELAGPGGDGPLHPQYVARTVSEMASADAVFTCDVGTPVIWAARYLEMNGQRSIVGSFTHGTMANALGHAIGAQAAYPGRQVVALCGDGGLSMLLGDLITLVQQELPVKIVVLNNASLAFVELEMKAAGIVNFGTGLTNPSFAAIARAMGMHGERVDQPNRLPHAISEAFEAPGPAVVEVMVARQELAIPPTVTASQAKGFTLYALRTVLSGRGDEVVDLARTNVFGRRRDR
ncbi:ubiquinone-dependent pyruvate dehydrogenase [Mumia sp. zg.B53]|uniref:ubiquinone-dependent pyruvate dehydrogenase n=1 Tax=unclassified Mumia TaxID=2621872 RepID=UPI001C6ECC83|nr:MULTISPECIES: ubiquinone-dependent pyruvate dehydrogenase [unclassified Mumia]MBW9205957.1 ubiquinone-dependent pyruvate dehydrogenase [Mumia sp. zg.B17]MBW9208039.1 ubiquinone-dependent pyruvate dehydrogenase [Mumia sp. zg.B21]MBW9215993.1 ubiquinone-dependent pyruvate dehydrogenase [Mumia sp. zg.B53]